jgi:hypothetical protein
MDEGPNFNIDIKDQVNNSTLPLSYLDLIKQIKLVLKINLIVY